MPLTKIWTAILAVLATAFLAGMFLLSSGAAGGFTAADRAAIRATTEAGVAALAAEIHASPVSRAPGLLQDPKLKRVLGTQNVEDGEKKDDVPPLQTAFVDVANQMLLSEYPQMTVALVNKEGDPIASSGVSGDLISEATALPLFKEIGADKEDQFSATLGSKLHVVKVSEADDQGRRLVAIQELNMGAGSFLRTVLGTENPAGIVRDSALLGSVIGDQPVEAEITALAETHSSSAPGTGASEVFTTSMDNQPFVPVHVLQGEREMAADNKSLARFELAPIPPAPRGVPEIEVAFDIDANGMLNVTAKDIRTGRDQSISVTASSGLSEDQINQIIADAEKFRASDVVRKELAELKNSAEALLYTSERAVVECAELVPDPVLKRVQVDIDRVKAMVAGQPSAGELRDALQQLELSAYGIAEAMYATDAMGSGEGDAGEG